MEYITISNKQYHTTKHIIKDICLHCGFDSVVFKTECINGKYKKGYYLATFKHSFKNLPDKLKHSVLVRKELNKLEVV